MGERRDEAELAARLLDADVTCRAARGVGEIGERELLREIGADFVQRQEVLDAIRLGLAHRHGFNQRDVRAAIVGEADELRDFAFVDVGERDGVDLHLDAGGDGGVDALHDIAEAVAARDLFEQVTLEGIERDVDAADADGGEVARVFRE